MALIKCPECDKEISDKSPACIHCGFPLGLLKKQTEPEVTKIKDDNIKKITVNNNAATSPNSYSLELLDYGNKKTPVALALKNTLKMKDIDALELVASAPCYLFRDKPECEIMPIIEKLDALPVKYNLYVDGKLTSYTKKIMCPNCSSFIEETSRACPICGFDGIGSYLLKLERDKQAKIKDYTHDYEPIIPKENAKNVPKYPTCQSTNITPSESVKNVPKCPTCQSTDIKRISALSKAGSVFMWGLLSQKVKKQWHCNNCSYEW